jgi:hypothetical protein
MALTPTQTSLCNSLSQQYDTLVAPVKLSKSTIRSKVRNLESSLRTTSFSPLSQVESAVDDLLTDTQASLPGDTDADMEELKNFIDACDFFGTASPVSAVLGAATGAYDAIDNLVDNTSLTTPEFGLGSIADEINKLLSGSGFPGGSNLSDQLKKADNLLNCLSSLCPGYSSRVSQIAADLTGLYTDLNIVDNPLDPNYGNLDYDAIYSNAGISSADQEKVNVAINGIANAKSAAKTAISNAAEKVKATLKIGGLF